MMMQRKVVLIGLLAALALPVFLVAARAPGRGRGRGKGKKVDYSCEWTTTMKEAAKKITSQRKFLYFFFNKPTPKLEGNFHMNVDMQAISKELLVFVDMTVRKPPEAAKSSNAPVTRLEPGND